MSAALSEAIKGFGSDDPHVAAARQNLAEQYRVMHKYDMALPLYNEVIHSHASSLWRGCQASRWMWLYVLYRVSQYSYQQQD